MYKYSNVWNCDPHSIRWWCTLWWYGDTTWNDDMMYTLLWWCELSCYDEHACLSTMMYTWWCMCNDALWCSCTRWWLWLWCKLDAYSLMILIWWCTLSLIHVFTWYDAVMLYYTLSRCIPCVQHKQSRVTCSVIVYDERYMSSMWHWYLQQIQRLDWHRLLYEQVVWLRLARLYEQLVWFRWIEFGVQTQIDSVGWLIGTA